MQNISLDGGKTKFEYNFETKEELEIVLKSCEAFGFGALASALRVKHRDVLDIAEHSILLTQKEVDIIYCLIGLVPGKAALDLHEKLYDHVSNDVVENDDRVQYRVSSDPMEGLTLKIKGLE